MRIDLIDLFWGWWAFSNSKQAATDDQPDASVKTEPPSDITALSSRLQELEAELSNSNLKMSSLQRELDTCKSQMAEYKRIASEVETVVVATQTEAKEKVEEALKREAAADAAMKEAEKELLLKEEALAVLKARLDELEEEKKSEIER